MKRTLTPAARVTMRDIARELGISHVTVSLALGGNPRIPEARRNQVKETARRMGYRPDPMLTALLHYRHARKSTPIRAAIAWLNNWPDPAELRSYREFDGYWQGAREVAEAHGYHLEEFISGKNNSFARLEKIFITRNIHGILLPPNPRPESLTAETLSWDRFATICFGHSHSSLPMHVVTADQLAAGRLAFAEVSRLGYKRIGYVTTESMMSRTLFAAGYLRSQNAIPADQRLPICSLPPAHERRQAEQALNAWFRQNRPDAIITDAGDLLTMLKAIKVKVPQEVGVAALSVLDGKADAGINQNPVEIGRVAAETLISLINHNHRGIPQFQRQILVEGFWRNGSTLPPRP